MHWLQVTWEFILNLHIYSTNGQKANPSPRRTCPPSPFEFMAVEPFLATRAQRAFIATGESSLFPFLFLSLK
jgi:hypothetical protein